MSLYKSSKITNSGQELLLKCLAGEAQMQFTRIAFGSGEYSSDSGIVAQTALKSQKQAVSISTISRKSANTVLCSAVLSNEELTEGYRITEVGLFAKNSLLDNSQEILYALCIAEDGYADYLPPYNGYAPVKVLQDFYIEVADSSSTTILVDDNVTVPMSYFNEKLAECVKGVKLGGGVNLSTLDSCMDDETIYYFTPPVTGEFGKVSAICTCVYRDGKQFVTNLQQNRYFIRYYDVNNKTWGSFSELLIGTNQLKDKAVTEAKISEALAAKINIVSAGTMELTLGGVGGAAITVICNYTKISNQVTVKIPKLDYSVLTSSYFFSLGGIPDTLKPAGDFSAFVSATDDFAYNDILQYNTESDGMFTIYRSSGSTNSEYYFNNETNGGFAGGMFTYIT